MTAGRHSVSVSGSRVINHWGYSSPFHPNQHLFWSFKWMVVHNLLNLVKRDFLTIKTHGGGRITTLVATVGTTVVAAILICVVTPLHPNHWINYSYALNASVLLISQFQSAETIFFELESMFRPPVVTVAMEVGVSVSIYGGPPLLLQPLKKFYWCIDLFSVGYVLDFFREVINFQSIY